MLFILILLAVIVSVALIVFIARELCIFDGPDMDQILVFIIETGFVIFLTIVLCVSLSILFK